MAVTTAFIVSLLIAVATNAQGAATNTNEIVTNTPGAATIAPGIVTNTPGAATSAPGIVTHTPGAATSAPGIVTNTPGAATSAPGIVTNTPGEATSAPGIVTHTPQPAPQLEFNCTNGKVENIDGSDIDQKAVVVDVGNGKMCHITENACKWTNKFETIHVIYDKKDTKANIVAGKPYYYELKCKSGGYVARATAKPLSIGLTTRSYIQKVFTPSNRPGITITLNKEGTEVTDPVEIGQLLSIQMIGPDNTTISPINCTATATAQNDDYPLWDNCTSKDKAIMENDWKITNNYTYSIDMYAFRFVDSKKVTIECSAFICPSSDPECTKKIKKCTQSSKGRRKRSTNLESNPLSEYEEETASVSFTVVDHFDGTNGSEEVFGNILLYFTSVLITTVFIGRE